MPTAHESYSAKVAEGVWVPYNDAIVLSLQKQVAGLAAERDAMREQIAALVTERDLLRCAHDALEAKCEALQLAEWRAAYSLEEMCKLLMLARQTADMWRRAYHGDGVAPE